ncbi:MAG TPA: hypothetical protein VFD84_08655 [Candidatus Binatia bacterium]|nr:hypothetical protein [Candidatus Binatia bacterium]
MGYFAETDFFEDGQLIELLNQILAGNLTLEWYRVDNVRARAVAADPRRGLTYADCNLGQYGYDDIPELVRNRNSMAARGSVLPAKLPDLGYTINRKSDVWADGVVVLYEEAKTRRWAPAVDVPWAELAARPDRTREAAMAQLSTLLAEVALVAMEAAARWVFSINQEFLELKSFLCAQMIDEARHVEAWRKRALVSGEGLGRASVSAEQGLKELLSAETYPEASVGVNLLLGSFVLAACRALAALADTHADRRLAVLSMQDVARSVAYGTAQVRYHLAHQPARAAVLAEYLDRTEHTVLGIFGSPEFLEPLVLLAGRGQQPAARARGGAFARRWFATAVEEYLARTAAAGLAAREERSRLARLVRASAA